MFVMNGNDVVNMVNLIATLNPDHVESIAHKALIYKCKEIVQTADRNGGTVPLSIYNN